MSNIALRLHHWEMLLQLQKAVEHGIKRVRNGFVIETSERYDLILGGFHINHPGELHNTLAIHLPKEHIGNPVSERDELREEMCHLSHALGDMRVELVRATERFRSLSEVATKCDLNTLGETIMSALGDWANKVGPKLDRVQSGLDTVQALVEKLQSTPGAITPEDQALLDQIEKKVDDIASDADSVPPVPPVTPGAP